MGDLWIRLRFKRECSWFARLGYSMSCELGPEEGHEKGRTLSAAASGADSALQCAANSAALDPTLVTGENGSSQSRLSPRPFSPIRLVIPS